MTLVRTVVIALACFSAVPMPFVAWDEHNMRLVMAAFPLVGLMVGGCYLAWGAVANALGFGMTLRGAVYALIPLLVTGGIHMDGFADVVDAQSSHASPERKREILKDPHVGAFASIGIGAYLLLSAALASELGPRQTLLLAGVPVVSRCLAGLASLAWPLSADEGMLATIRSMANVRTTCALLAGELAVAAAALVVIDPLMGGATLAASGLAFAWVGRFAQREFGGMSGDLTGFLLQVVELVALLCIVLTGRMAWP